MLAFAIYINGRKSCTIGLNEPGVVTTNLTWVRGQKESKQEADDLFAMASGLVSRTGTHLTWIQRQIKIGDVIEIKIIEAEDISKPKFKRRETAATRTKRTKSYVRRTAESFGWTITEGKK
jgi:hypothetical protein